MEVALPDMSSSRTPHVRFREHGIVSLARSKRDSPEADLRRVFEAPTQEAAYRELIAINSEVASIAVALAAGAVRELREAVALIKAAGSKFESGDLTLEELLATVREAGATGEQVSSIPAGDIDSVEKLASVLSTGDGIEEFEKAVGIGDESDGLEQHPSGSRRWRNPGRLPS